MADPMHDIRRIAQQFARLMQVAHPTHWRAGGWVVLLHLHDNWLAETR
jgi:hypothetical protein